MKNPTYASDFSGWLARTVQLLREQRWAEIDVEHLIEEVENVGKSERRGLTSQLTRLLIHLLKWRYQPWRRTDSWLDSITDARTQIQLTIEDNPGFQNYPGEQFALCYRRARQGAAEQTGIDLKTFPEECPFPLASVLQTGWLPE